MVVPITEVQAQERVFMKISPNCGNLLGLEGGGGGGGEEGGS